MDKVTVIGAGLAGCEAAWQIARRGINVRLVDMKPSKFSPAHTNPDFCELVCSNSLRANDLACAPGLLKEELRKLDSLVIKCADETAVDAGGALAVDRKGFSEKVTAAVKNNPLIEVVCEEVRQIPEDGYVIIATGPLTDGELYKNINEFFEEDEADNSEDGYMHFYDAAAPVITAESIDMQKAFEASRYGKGTGRDYINCPMSQEEYLAFVEQLVSAEQAPVHGFEDSKVFEGCMPVEVMARRGIDTLRHGPLKPVGLTDPRTGKEAYAVVQLRRDNAAGTLYNIVGFQTHLKFGEQKRVFSMIPALTNAEIVRYGVMHRNSYINSPKVLDRFYRAKKEPRIMFAGQFNGVEGYIESVASGLYAGINAARTVKGEPMLELPRTTAVGALAAYVSNPTITKFQPMNINFGIIEPLGYRVKGKREKNTAISERALKILDEIKSQAE